MGNGKWIEQAILTSSDGRAGDIFGSDFDIGNNRIVVGAQWADVNPLFTNPGTQQGKAYVFYK